jgi:phosphodiesterase/alkaline phosphatase D-like protein
MAFLEPRVASGPRGLGLILLSVAATTLAVAYGLGLTAQVPGPCDPPNSNQIVCENLKPGDPASAWDVNGVGDTSIQGFATDISVNRGQTVSFKVSTNASQYRLDIYRLGYYAGLGARKVATVNPSVSLPQNQPSCLTNSATGLVDCGNWAVSASWAVPSSAVSGIYIAKAIRTDTGGASHIVFVVRDDTSHADVLFQTSDTTWHAYNSYGGNSLYVGAPAGRAFKVSYNRPFNNRSQGGGPRESYLFNAEYPMVRWLEANGYNVSYSTGVDTDRRGAELLEHRMFLSIGHDEYWSANQRGNVEAARNAGVNLAFLSANEVFWKTRWENSIDASSIPYRTLVCYKETLASAKIDPLPNVWTGTWRDPRFSPPADGGRPENALTGTLFMVNGTRHDAISVPAADGRLRFWRNTSVASLPPGAEATLPTGTLGYEWDIDPENGWRPAGQIRMSSSTYNVTPLFLQDYGATYGSGVATHSLTLYRHSSGALVFGAGTVQWSWGLDATHDREGEPADVRMQQATVNLLADMGIQPLTLQAGLVTAVQSTDSVAPTAMISSPSNGASFQAGGSILVTGTASDAGSGVVGAVEVSVDGGATWRLATGRETWTFATTFMEVGPATIRARAVDDSGNIQAVPTVINLTILPDQTPPQITGVQIASALSTWATVTWTTNEIADSQVEFGATAAYGTLMALDPTMVTNHVASLTGLSPNSTYHYRVRSRDQWGNLAISGNFTLTTPSGSAVQTVTFDDLPGQDQPLNGAYPASVMTWGTGDWWHSGPYGEFTTKSISFASSNTFSLGVTFVNPLRLLSIDAYNGDGTSATITLSCPGQVTAQAVVAAGQVRTISTGWTQSCSSMTIGSTTGWGTNFDNMVFDAPPDVVPPVLSGVQATGVTATRATIVWNTNEPANGQIEYGLTAAYGSLSPLVSALTTTHSIAVTGLSASTTYHVRVRSRDAANNLVVSGDGTFTTAPPDVTPPVLSAVQATLVTGSAARVTWNSNELADTQVEYGLTTAYGSQSLLDGAFVANHVVTLSSLTAGTTYHFRVRSRDESGNLTVSGDGTFITASAGACPCSIWPLSTTPVIPSQSDTNAVELGVRFRADADGYITGLRFYKGTTNTGTHLGHLWTDAGTLLATATFTNETASGWQEVAFADAVFVTANTTYVASYYAPNGGYSLNPSYFTASVDAPPLHAPADGVSGANGVYRYGASAFPTSTFGASNYWVDVVYFRPPDVVAPIISAVQATTMMSSATVTWTTNEPADSVVEYGLTSSYGSTTPLDSTMVTAHSVPITGLPMGTTYHYRIRTRDAAGNLAVSADLTFTTAVPDTTPPGFAAIQASLVTGTTARISWTTSEPADTQVEYGPTTGYGTLTALVSTLTTGHGISLSGLAVGTTYHYRVRSRDAAGNLGISADGVLSTPGAGTCPCSIWPLSATPAVASQSDSNSVELGVRFRADADGFITGLRFYKGAANTGVHVANLWTNAGVLMATTTFANETATGWQEVAFASPVAVTANTTYVGSYLAPNGGYAVTSGYFGSSADAPPLHAPSSGSSGGNGLYSYGAGGFPTNTYNAGNYWVDVVYVDGTPPVISGAQATAAATSATVTWNTNEPANGQVEYGLTAGYGSLSTLVTALTAGHSIGLSGLTSATMYHYRIRTRDASGNLALSSDLTFTTGISDTTPPAISAVQATLVTGTTARVSWTTGEPADTQVEYGLTTSYGTLTSLDSTMATGHGVALGGLVAGTTYHYRVRSRDAAGNLGLSADNVFSTPASGGCPCSLWPLSATPAVASQNDPNGVELGVRFRADANGFITGLRFYRGGANTGVHVAHLWTNAGVLLATATFSNETASGWQEVTFAAPVPVTANTTYVASYFAPNGGYAVTAGYFGTGTDAPPLHAPSSGASGGNGLYVYGGGFPSNTYNAGNYWIDVVFKP